MFDALDAGAPSTGPAGDSAAGSGSSSDPALRGICGDINLFLFSEDSHEAGDYADAAEAFLKAEEEGKPLAALPESSEASAPRKVRVAEVMVMIAEPAYRRKGHAAAAVALILEYARLHLGIDIFVAKISDSNAPSLALFTDKLGFRVAKKLSFFEETHLVRKLRAGVKSSADAAADAADDADAAAAGSGAAAAGSAAAPLSQLTVEAVQERLGYAEAVFDHETLQEAIPASAASGSATSTANL